MAKKEEANIKVVIQGVPEFKRDSIYECNVLFRSNFSPNTTIRCQNIQEPIEFDAMDRDLKSWEIPLDWFEDIPVSYNTEAIFINPGRVKMDTFTIHRNYNFYSGINEDVVIRDIKRILDHF